MRVAMPHLIATNWFVSNVDERRCTDLCGGRLQEILPQSKGVRFGTGCRTRFTIFSAGTTPRSSLRRDEFWAVNEVSFELKRGECLGLIGRNGAGKTTLLKMLNGLIKPDRGRIEMRGRVGALIALGAGFNPILDWSRKHLCKRRGARLEQKGD